MHTRRIAATLLEITAVAVMAWFACTSTAQDTGAGPLLVAGTAMVVGAVLRNGLWFARSKVAAAAIFVGLAILMVRFVQTVKQ